MSGVAEVNQFYKGKIPILEEYSNQHRALMSTVAGRGFCKIPGFLHEASLTLEEAGKNKLSALNYQIVAEAIERELKQVGHDYTQAHKAARIAFELEKQTLLTALQQEFADLDAVQSLAEEELNRLFVELDIRRVILITTKTIIELQMEVLKQELIGVDRLTFTNEELLINERIVTANAKLAVISHLEDLIEAQGKILVAEEANFPYMEDLIDEKGLLISKKEELVPFIIDKAETRIDLANKKEEILPYIENKADAQVALANKREEILAYIETKIDAQVELSDIKTDLLVYIEGKIDAKIDLINKKKELLPYMQDEAEARQELAFKKEELIPYLEDKAASIIEVAYKKIELLPYLVEKANKIKELASALIVEISYRNSIMDALVEKAGYRKEIADSKLDLINAEAAVISARSALMTVRNDYKISQIDGQTLITDGQTENIATRATSHDAMMIALAKDDAEIISEDQTTNATISENRDIGRAGIVDTATMADKESIGDVATANAERLTGVANAQAEANITAELIHLLAGG